LRLRLGLVIIETRSQYAGVRSVQLSKAILRLSVSIPAFVLGYGPGNLNLRA